MAPPPKVKPPVSQTKAPHLQPNPNFALQNSTTSSAGTDSCASSKRRTSQGQAREGVATITDGLDKLAVTGEGLSQHPQKEPNTEVVNVANGTEDDRSQLSNSSTKPASFDTKSMASENTFAMEEKESLRPDDSASVQAADEEEPFFVPPVLGKPDSQAAVAINPGLRRPPPDGPVALGSQGRFPMTTMINPPRFGDIVPNVPPHFPQNGAPPIPFAANQNDVSSLQQYSASSIAPDEKIIEALGTPKDRLLLLQLEEKFLAFISQSRYDIEDSYALGLALIFYPGMLYSICLHRTPTKDS